MIWRSPGFPSLLVTYGTASDLFFSGHTAVAVYGCLELAHQGGTLGIVLGVALALIEAGTVLVLRAHYTLDVFTGAITALWVWGLAWRLAPAVDAALLALSRQ
jgi:membrane-associated phospholipid phosphatase